jgi:transcription-repair coupling factor (superfamily II helicase)
VERKDVITIYKSHPAVAQLKALLKEEKLPSIQIKGLSGSMDAFIAAGSIMQTKRPHLFILGDREEAAYFQNDLENILQQTVEFFPMSYKRPYEYEEIDNANVLERSEVLSKINDDPKHIVITTYPEALPEKVINKRSLVKNTFGLKVGEEIDQEFLSEVLLEYGFTQTDFVYEAGNFSIRGGIIDIYSFANDLPYRVEFFGNEVESIRTFDPETQLSQKQQTHISIIPDIQNKLLEEKRESFLDFLPKDTIIWCNHTALLFEVIEKSYEKISANFAKIKESNGEFSILTEPDQLIVQPQQFRAEFLARTIIEFGGKSFLKSRHTVEVKSSPQPSFNKTFKLLLENLKDYELKEYQAKLCSASPRQVARLTEILEDLDGGRPFDPIPFDIRAGFIDHDEKLLFYSDHQIFERYYKYKVKDKFSRSKALTIKELKDLKPGDYVTHIDYGVGIFAGMERKEVNGKKQESIRIIYRDDDVLYVSVHSLHKISKFSGQEGKPPSVSKLGSSEWETKKKKVKKKVKELAINLIELYAKRKEAPGFAFSKDSYLQAELETSFLYEDTPDQAKATEDVKFDMEQAHPMDRLVCGDVGFGKTEVAIRAAFKAVNDSKQVAILVPTTVLAMQHHNTFSERMKTLPVRVEFINRFRTAKEIKDVLKDAAEGKVDILIGTHRIISKDVKFKDLGLLVIDEEQKFGVAVKEKLKEFRINVDVLTLTATPIPRTLQFSLMSARDISVIATPPPNRRPVTTELHSFKEEVVRDAVSYEMKRGGQVFFVHNRIADIEGIANIIMKLVPDARVGVVHGQMDGKQLEKVMLRFINHDYDVLVSTNLIESGLDIPNANTIIINQAHMYGMSDLHQMRGRVGRSNKKAFCYLMTPTLAGLTLDARKRLKTLEEFSDLGDGFKIAMRDLDIRGAGNLLGGEQSGFINDIGFDTYHKLLEDAIKELKETEFKDLFGKDPINAQKLKPKTDCNIETDFEVLIPEEYVSNISERLRLYNELDNIHTQEKLDAFKKQLKDRFGDMPQAVIDLTKTVEIRWKAELLGFEKLRVKENIIKGYVPIKNNDAYFQSPTFGQILDYVQHHPKQTSVKEYKGNMIITFRNIKTLDDAYDRLASICKKVMEVVEE